MRCVNESCGNRCRSGGKDLSCPRFSGLPRGRDKRSIRQASGKSGSPGSAAGRKAFTDYGELLRSGAADAVTICTRTDMHCSMAVQAAKAGKHIFLEKPMATSAAEAKEICEETERAGVTFMLGMLNRFRTESLILTERREAGLMGDIYHADARWIRRRGIPSNGWFVQKALSGGGAGIDIGVHAIDTAWYLMGSPEPVAVSAVTHSRLGDAGARGLSSWGTEAPAGRPMGRGRGGGRSDTF